MALVFVRYSINGQHGSGRIINTNNIESIFKLGDMIEPKFKVFLMNGEVVNFSQLYYNGNFVTLRTMEQIYTLLSKLDSRVIQDGSA
ncbi:hypothetical protein GMC94_03525 [Streptococcus parasanguinis]|uniref:Uncharacterized protein n=1 Tax=Streptococcus parasanguinis TaxID=1318 RepID=A0A7X2X3G4_STRPA|nr:hypothetical protein [Streptococcus parasanguinis]MTS53967.1 hypothetical protein [Streptococcus parasanguinis]RYS58385.1 hypothetical protein EAI79_03560 [Streptococcus parasanguinis]